MIISHSGKSNFLHTPKTAGTSLITYMDALLQPEDFSPHRLGINNANATYRNYYGDEELALVKQMYSRELQTFDYEF